MRPRPALWIAWLLALVGGLAVLAAAALLLADPCAEGGPCVAGRPQAATYLAVGGTGLAVAGGATATWLTLRCQESGPP